MAYLSYGVAKDTHSPVDILFSLLIHIVYLGKMCTYPNKQDTQVLTTLQLFARIISTHP